MVEMFMYNYIVSPTSVFPHQYPLNWQMMLLGRAPWFMNRDTPLTFKEKLSHFEFLTTSRKTFLKQNTLNTIFPTNPTMSIQLGLLLLSIISRLERIFPTLTNERTAIWLRQMGMSHLANWSRWDTLVQSAESNSLVDYHERANPKDLEIQVYKRMGNRAPPLSAGQLGSLNSEQNIQLEHNSANQ